MKNKLPNLMHLKFIPCSYKIQNGVSKPKLLSFPLLALPFSAHSFQGDTACFPPADRKGNSVEHGR